MAVIDSRTEAGEFLMIELWEQAREWFADHCTKGSGVRNYGGFLRCYGGDIPRPALEGEADKILDCLFRLPAPDAWTLVSAELFHASTYRQARCAALEALALEYRNYDPPPPDQGIQYEPLRGHELDGYHQMIAEEIMAGLSWWSRLPRLDDFSFTKPDQAVEFDPRTELSLQVEAQEDAYRRRDFQDFPPKSFVLAMEVLEESFTLGERETLWRCQRKEVQKRAARPLLLKFGRLIHRRMDFPHPCRAIPPDPDMIH